jgi:uncharacterized protein (TIGR03083 family)
MTARTYAAWVQPLAREFAENRQAVLDFARLLPAESWERSSPLEGWTYRDILAHLASGNDKQVQYLLGCVVNRTPLDPAMFGNADSQNARNVAERQGRSVKELIAELEEDGEACLDLMAKLTDADGERRQKGFDQSFGEALPLFTRHDLEHLSQLKTALEE